MSSPTILNNTTQLRAFHLAPEFRLLAIVVATSAAVIVPAVVFGIPSSRDLTNHFRFALPFYDAVTHGNFYPSWLAESNGGLGDASFRFYPPALYYLLTAVRLLTGNWYSATLITFSLLFVAGALGVYGWARSLFTPRIAMWAAILFTVSPYHLNQFYQSSLLAEFAACSILPFGFWFIERIRQRQTSTNIAGLAVVYALLILTHLPLTVLGSLALLVYSLVRLPKHDRKRMLMALVSAVVIGLALSSFYWVTMIAEKGWIRADQIQPEPSVNYRLNFVFSTFSPDNLNVWWMNILVLLSGLMFAPSLILLWRSKRRANTGGMRALVALLALAFLMTTELSLPLWKLLKPLQETQFPWRWLGILSVAGAILTAASLPSWLELARGRFRPLFLIAISSMVVPVAFSASHIVREAVYLSASQFESVLTSVRGSQSIRQWLPVWAGDRIGQMNANVELPPRQIETLSWTPEKRVFSVSEGPTGEARVHTFYYPYWVATSGQQQLEVKPSEDGLLLVNVPPQASTITLQFIEPSRTRASVIVSALGLLAVVGFLILGRRRSEYPLA